MVLSNITFKNETYPLITPLESFAWGVMGDTLSFTCDLTLLASAGALDFYFNFIPNSKSPYTNPTSFEILPDIFKNLHSQTIQVFKGKLPTSNGQQLTLTPVNPANFFSGTFSVLGVNVASKQYKILGTFKLLPLVRAIDLNGSNFVIPSYFSGGESLKAVFKVNTKVSDLNATVVESTDTINTNGLFKNGNIGYLNERLNGGVADFSLQPNSTAWQNGLANLDSSQISTCKFQLKKTSGNFLANAKITVRSTTPIDTFDTTNYLTTQNFDEVLLQPNGTLANGINSKLVSCKASINAMDSTLLDVEVSFASGSYTKAALWCEISENTTSVIFDNYNSNNVWIFFVEETSQVIDPVELQPLGDAGFPSSFLYHYSDNVSEQNYNHLVSFVQDWQQGWTKIVPKNGASIEQIAIQLKRKSGAILDNIGTYNTENLPIIITRPFNLLNTELGGGYRQQIAIEKVGNDISCKFAFKILPDWTAFADIVAAVIVRGTQRGLPFDIEFQSPSSVLQTYELSLNDNTQPKALGYPTSKKIFVDGNEVSKIIKGKENLLRFYFRDDNLNNLQATLADLVAYFTVNYKNEGISTQNSIHSEWDINPNSPFKEVAGHTPGRVKITLIDPPNPSKEAFIECILDATKLVSIYGEQKEYRIAGRLDKIPPPTYTERHLLHCRGNNSNGNNFYPVISFTSGIGNFNIDDILGMTSQIQYKYSEAINPNWSAITAVNKASLLSLIGLGSGTFKVQIIPTILPQYNECFIIFKYQKQGLAPANSWTYNFTDTNSIETCIPFDNLINITSIGGITVNTKFRIMINPTADWNSATLVDLATINAQIGGLAPGTKFALQVMNYEQSTLTFNYTYL